ncbi:oleate hydratase [Flavobacterium psychrophilum DSM 3660]|uniref:oleate hydratase n=1 Tax=Flavobacterium psychrophilum TaxID=96345 RepID=UPI0004F8C3A8|nr:oleate hydratase [Flavobacterium psychrophilum]AIN74723.1 oleate hydratase [Flavobacterium psychrophilum FPG3]EKT2072283.1 oleate hydratase [Flavobacterium psychrophilum]EKT4491712.1 oleate hydratase [Flavobacterium psychrophilum]MBF2044236.1 oleate hydratase [Flavobacterium psychrophilum]OXB13713.1 oleate hydratase [Flavobacterium psychrophilum] [Flavobacterium psychrophilum DSM 3660 = ATCC 49418]
MNKETSKFDKVLNVSPFLGNVNHTPDASKDVVRNSKDISMPFADLTGNYQRNKGIPSKSFKDSKVYIVGSGIAGLSAAYYFIRDGHVLGKNIIFLDKLSIAGGSLDGAGNANDGYIIRGGREMEMTYENLWDIFQDIPALELPAPYSVLDEYRLLNDNDPNYSKARLIHNKGVVKDFSKFGLEKKDQLAIVKLLLKKKEDLDDLTIEDYFSKSFLQSNFWFLWRTMFAFENWHSLLECKLYMHRFLHTIDGMKDLSCLIFPKYNQYDTFVKPLTEHLKSKGVKIQFDTLVKDLDIQINSEGKIVKGIITKQNNKEVVIPITKNDYVIVTTGSMTEDTSYGTNTKPAIAGLDNNESGESAGWELWKNLAAKSSVFGIPEKFCSSIEKSAWQSATLTCRPSDLTEKFKEYCVNDPYSGKTATGGIVTITDSNWLMSFTINRQPHYPTQPDDILVVWVYALYIDKPGNYVQKTMTQCTGNEILSELCYHLGLENQLENVIENTIVRTAFMPYITSMFLPRATGDRPEIVPEGCKNLGLVGQFVETKNDVVFTVESSVRTARTAVYKLLNSNKQVPDIAGTQYDIRQLLKATKALNDNMPFPGESILRKVLKNTYFEHILPNNDQTEEHHESFISEQFGKLQEWAKSL